MEKEEDLVDKVVPTHLIEKVEELKLEDEEQKDSSAMDEEEVESDDPAGVYIAPGWKPLIQTKVQTKDIVNTAVGRYKKLAAAVQKKVRTALDYGKYPICTLPNPNTKTLVHITETKNYKDWSELVKAKTIFDKYAQGIDRHVRNCQYKTADSFYLYFHNNRLTVSSDQVWDSQFRPLFSFLNLKQVPLKSDTDRYAKLSEKERIITTADFGIGSDESGCMAIVGDKAGCVYFLDFHLRVNDFYDYPFQDCSPQATKLDTKFLTSIEHIRCHAQSNIVTVMGKKRDAPAHEKLFAFYCKPNCETMRNPDMIGNMKLTIPNEEDVVQMEWFKNSLLIMTESHLYVVEDLKAKSLKKNTLRGKNFAKNPFDKTMKLRLIYTPTTKGEKLGNFTIFDEETILIAWNSNIQEYNLKEKKIVKTFTNSYFDGRLGYALHPSKRAIAFASKGGEWYLCEYRSGKVKQKMGKKRQFKDAVYMHWAKNGRDNLMVWTTKRAMRYRMEGYQLPSSKPTPMDAYYSGGSPIYVNYWKMDNTNIDHDHRSYQYAFKGNEKKGSTVYDRVPADFWKSRDMIVQKDREIYYKLFGKNLPGIPDGAKLPEKEESKEENEDEKNRSAEEEEEEAEETPSEIQAQDSEKQINDSSKGKKRPNETEPTNQPTLKKPCTSTSKEEEELAEPLVQKEIQSPTAKKVAEKEPSKNEKEIPSRKRKRQEEKEEPKEDTTKKAKQKNTKPDKPMKSAARPAPKKKSVKKKS